MVETRISRLDFALEMLGFIGMEIVPLIYILTPWLDFANFDIHPWIGWVGVGVLVYAVWLLWRAHADLGRNWSSILQISKSHWLVTSGVYAYIRHPIYAAVWLTAVAQVMLLANWIAGPACLVLFMPVYMRRVPREEQMMRDHFGAEYEAYLERTGRVVPRFLRK